MGSCGFMGFFGYIWVSTWKSLSDSFLLRLLDVVRLSWWWLYFSFIVPVYACTLPNNFHLNIQDHLWTFKSLWIYDGNNSSVSICKCLNQGILTFLITLSSDPLPVLKQKLNITVISTSHIISCVLYCYHLISLRLVLWYTHDKCSFRFLRTESLNLWPLQSFLIFPSQASWSHTGSGHIPI